MKVGLYFDMRNPPERAVDKSRLYGFTLDMCQEAEKLGCDSIWLSEHHLFDDGYLPQPLVMAAAVAARTKRVRIGTAIVIAPLYHPAHLAEQVAIVDAISGGRLDLGLGAGYRVPEFDLFDADITRKYTSTDNCVRQLRRLWTELTPAPVQTPVPIWMGYSGPQGARRAGLLGEGLLAIAPALGEPYKAGLIEGGFDPATQGRMAGGVNGWVCEDPERDWPMASAHIAAQLDSYRRHMVQGTDTPVPRPVDPERLRNRDNPKNPLDSVIFGTPQFVADRIAKATQGTPTETVFFWASIAGMSEDVVARNVHTICTKLAPLLAPVQASAA